MIVGKFKLWRVAGAAAALGLAASCGGEGGEAASGRESGGTTAVGEGGEAAVGESGGEHGESGIDTAYAGVAGSQLAALRLQHLKGFVLVAARVAEAGDAPAAGILVQQGVLEVYEPAADQFGALDAAALRAAGSAASAQSLQAAKQALDAARPGDADAAQLAVSMVDIASGLYQSVVHDDFVDPIEYQHSLGAALAARDALAAGRAALRARNARAYDVALADIEALIALWPSTEAPERPTPYREVLAQSSRVRLALSPFL